MKVELKFCTKLGEVVISEDLGDKLDPTSDIQKLNRMGYTVSNILNTYGQPSWMENNGILIDNKNAQKAPKSAPEKKPAIKKDESLATEKQKAFIKKYLNINLASDVTKECAAEMIRDFKKENGWTE